MDGKDWLRPWDGCITIFEYNMIYVTVLFLQFVCIAFFTAKYCIYNDVTAQKSSIVITVCFAIHLLDSESEALIPQMEIFCHFP